MPLSEHEQQMLEQMEQALASEDPRFAHQMRGGTTLAVRRRRLVLGILGVVIGLALVVVAVPCTGRVIGLLPGGNGCGLRALGCAVAPPASIARALPSATECERVVAVRRPVPVMANVVSMLPCNFE